jgi:GntR family transcriptional regulator/MocR family aminotransferase
LARTEPGYPAARAVFAAHGAHVVPCRADEHGLVTGELPAGLRLVYTTPAHQYPLGGRLPVPRRQSLIAWARATGALIVEDDYDSEFRYDVAPLPALFGLDPDVVVHLGTTAKTLTPAMGVGWLAARDDLAGRAAQPGRRASTRQSAGPPAQRAGDAPGQRGPARDGGQPTRVSEPAAGARCSKISSKSASPGCSPRSCCSSPRR